MPALGAEHRAADVGEGLDAAGAIGAELAVVLGADLALGDLLDIAAAADPVPPQLGQAGHDVDAGLRIGIGAGGVVDADRRLVGRGLQRDLAHRHAMLADVDLLRAADRAGRYLELGVGGALAAAGSQIDLRINVGHGFASPSTEGERMPAPSLRRYHPDQVLRVAATKPPLSHVHAAPRGWPECRRTAPRLKGNI